MWGACVRVRVCMRMHVYMCTRVTYVHACLLHTLLHSENKSVGGNTTATIVQVRRPGLRAGLGGGGRHGIRFILGSQPSSATNLLGHLG